MQRETYVNRKIPLNGYLSLFIGGIKNLKEGMNNIHYLTSLNKNPDVNTSIHDWTFVSTLCTKRIHDNRDVVDKQRALTQIYREGLNLGIVISVFDESEELRDTFGKQATKCLLKTLNPIFHHQEEFRIKMDTKIFEYFKNCRAVLEIRHYFIENEQSLLWVGHMDNES